MKNGCRFGKRMASATLAGCAIMASVAVFGDTAFKAGEWDVAFDAEGTTLKLTHRPSGIEVGGEYGIAPVVG